LEKVLLFSWICFLFFICISFPSSMPMILGFGLLMVSQKTIYCSCILTYYCLRVLIHQTCYRPWYSVFYLIQSMAKAFYWVFHLTYWVFHFQKFKLILISIPISLLNSSFDPLLHSAVHLSYLWIH
jgi:hypothetical protein